MEEATVYIVDDDKPLCHALSQIINMVSLKNISCHSGEDLLASFPLSKIGCILLDIRMGGLSGLELQQVILQKECKLPIIFLTGHASVRIAVQAVQLGAFDFLEKPFDNDKLVKLVQSAVTLSQKTNDKKHKLDILTNAELEVFDHLVRGKTNKEIATEKGLSVRTVEFHRSNIKDKTNSNTLADLIKLTNSNNE